MLQKIGLLLGLVTVCHTNYPIFDIQTQMRQVLIPSDAKIGSIIYRLRATDADRDYPLNFDATDYGSYVVKIESLPCTKKEEFCMANVYLERTLIPGQLFKFRVTVRDTKGDTTTIPVAIHVTDGVTETDLIFPHIPGVIMVPEDTPVGSEIEYVLARKNPRLNRPAILELWGPPNFEIEQTSKMDVTRGAIKIAKPLDYEEKTMYTLNIYSIDMYTDNEIDTRNVAGFQIVIIVLDVQDTPPVWDHIEPLTKLPQNITEGDIVMTVRAIDGDRGSPRPIKYGLVSEGNPFTVFFDIDQKQGTIRLVRPLKELISISRSHQPILLTVIAEEEVKDRNEPPAMSSTATIALLLSEVANSPPYFHNQNYVCRVDENSLQGTALIFGDPYITEVKDDDMGKQGIFSLTLENNNGTFEITPTVAERSANFVIRVRDNTLLDYEQRHTVILKIVATEVSPGNPGLSSAANVLVYIDDVNDNEPVFLQPQYVAQIAENATMGMYVKTVKANDLDTGQGGVIKYTRITGYKNSSLSLHPQSGMITIAMNNHGLDREEASEYRFFVEARDMAGTGNSATTILILQILDVNDETPTFLKNPYDFILSPDRSNFSQRAFVEAIDKDAEPPNNAVRYEIISGNYGNSFSINPETGELTVRSIQYNKKRQVNERMDNSVTILTVRAYDLGIPTLWSVAEVRIFPPENGARVMTFIVPGSNPDRKALQDMLSLLTAGRVSIQSIRPYYAGLPLQGATRDLAIGYPDTDKSVVVATVMYNGNTVIDIEQLQQRLTKNKTGLIVSTASVGEYHYENKILFWILLLILLLIALAILTLLLCCLCSGCPLYAAFNRKRRVHSPEDGYTGKKQGHESKGVQAEWSGGYKEAWSGDASHRNQWHFSRRNEQQQQQRLVLVGKGQPEYVRLPRDVVLPRDRARHGGPNVIYTQDIANRQGGEPVFVEDIDGAEYRVLDPSRLAMRGHHDDDTDSIRRHEYERGSDGGRRMKVSEKELIDDMPQSRDQMFIRDGNAEILRLVTRGRIEEEDGPGLNQPDRPFTVVHDTKDNKHEDEGKDIIMKRFMEDQRRREGGSTQRTTQAEVDDEDQEKQDEKEEEEDKRDGDLIRRLMEYKPDPETLSQDVSRLTVLQRDLLLTRFLVEEQRRFLGHASSSVDETQSLPGVMTSMGTQTDRDRSTQTEEGFYTMRPPRRKVKSDNDESVSDSELEERKAEIRKKSFNRHGRKLRYNQRRHKMDNFDDIVNRNEKRCEIKTPILEETESAVEAATAAAAYTRDEKPNFAATKSSLLRKQSTRIKLYMLRTAGGRAVEEATVPDSFKSSETYNIILDKDSSGEESEGKISKGSKSQSIGGDRRDGKQHSPFQSASYAMGAMSNLVGSSHPQSPVISQQLTHQNIPSMHATAQAMGSFKDFRNIERHSPPTEVADTDIGHAASFHSATHAIGSAIGMTGQCSPVSDVGSRRGDSPSFHSATQALGSAMGMVGNVQYSQSYQPSEQGSQHSASFYATSQAVETVFGLASEAQELELQRNSPSLIGFSGEVQIMEPESSHSPSFHTTSQFVGTVVGASKPGQEDEELQNVQKSPRDNHPSIYSVAAASHMAPKLNLPEDQSEHIVPSVDPALLNTSDLSESGRESESGETNNLKSMMGALKGFARFGNARKKAKLKSSSESQLPTLTSTAHTLEAAKELSGKAKAKSLHSTPVSKKRLMGIVSLSRLFTPAKDQTKSQPHSSTHLSAKSKQGSVTSKSSTEILIVEKKQNQSSGETGRLGGKKELEKSAAVLKTLEAFKKEEKPTRVPRYMEWYKKKKEERERKKSDEKLEKLEKPERHEKPEKVVNTVKFMKSLKRQDTKKEKEKDRRGLEDDLDSGIAMSLMMPPSQTLRRRNQSLLEKKSVFTIAYDEMQTKKLSTDNSTPP